MKSLQETDAAYRDGIFWGDRDAREGRKLQPSMARWHDEKDRASFKTGYEKGYRQALDSGNLQQRGEERDRRNGGLGDKNGTSPFTMEGKALTVLPAGTVALFDARSGPGRGLAS